MQTDSYVFSVFAVLASIYMRTYALFERVQALSYAQTYYLNACAKSHMCFRPFSMLAYINVCAYDISCFFKKATPAFFADVAKSIYVREMRRFDAPLFPTIAS